MRFLRGTKLVSIAAAAILVAACSSAATPA